MILRIYILFSIFFIQNALNAFPLVKKSTNILYPIENYTPKPYNQISYMHPITYFMFLMKTISINNNLIDEITNTILEYCKLLKKEDCMKKLSRLDKWDHFNIPIKYQCVLSSDQLNTLDNLFANKCIVIEDETQPVVEYIYHVLPSKEHYKQFLQLPTEVRSCLTSKSSTKKNPNVEKQNITRHETILIFNSHHNYFEHKPIIPKGKNKRRYALPW